MTSDHIREAAQFLWRAWSEDRHVEAIPESVRPATREEGYAIQQQLANEAGQPTVGWKIAATSIAGQKHLQVDGPLAGRLLANRVHPDGTSIPLGNNGMRVAEAEFCFRMGSDLPPRPEPYALDEVLAAIGELHPAIEIPDSRYIEFCQAGMAQLIADNACAHHFVLGNPAPADWRSVDLGQHKVRAAVNDGPPRDGVGANVLGDPRLAIVWVANELRTQGFGLQAGQLVTTGTSIVPVAVESGSRVVADFGPFGTVTAVVS